MRHELEHGHGLTDKTEIVALSKARAHPGQLKEQVAPEARCEEDAHGDVGVSRKGVPEVLGHWSR